MPQPKRNCKRKEDLRQDYDSEEKENLTDTLVSSVEHLDKRTRLRPRPVQELPPTPQHRENGFAMRRNKSSPANRPIHLGGTATTPIKTMSDLGVQGTPRLAALDEEGLRRSVGGTRYQQLAVVKIHKKGKPERRVTVWQGGADAGASIFYRNTSRPDAKLKSRPSARPSEPVKEVKEKVTKAVLKRVPKMRTDGISMLGASARDILSHHEEVINEGHKYEINHIIACCNGAEVLVPRERLAEIAVVATAAFNSLRYFAIENPIRKFVLKGRDFEYNASMKLMEKDGQPTHIAAEEQTSASWEACDTGDKIEITLDPHCTLAPSAAFEKVLSSLYRFTFDQEEAAQVAKKPYPAVYHDIVGLFAPARDDDDSAAEKSSAPVVS